MCSPVIIYPNLVLDRKMNELWSVIIHLSNPKNNGFDINVIFEILFFIHSQPHVDGD